MGKLSKKLLILATTFVLLISMLGIIHFKNKQELNKNVIITAPPDNVFSRNTPTPLLTKKPTSVISPTPYIISNDLPPLYPSVEWGSPKVGTYSFTDALDNSIGLTGSRLEAFTNEAVSEDYIEYYSNFLVNQGWKETLDAGGPPGIILGFQKENQFLNIGVDYTPEGPGAGRKIVKYTIYIEYSQ